MPPVHAEGFFARPQVKPGAGWKIKLVLWWRKQAATFSLRMAAIARAPLSAAGMRFMYYYFLPLESMAGAIQLASYLLTLVAATFAFLWIRP